MASMNWLGFSLSPQELPSQGSNHADLSGTGECYDLGSHDSTAPSSFDILEAFHRSNENQPQDWNNMKGSSEISMLMGNQQGDEQPKLENFLGNSHSFRENNNHHQNHGNYIFNDNTMTNPNNNSNTTSNNNNTTNNNALNVSMIKTWLRSNNPNQQEMVMMSKNNFNDNNRGVNGNGTGAQSLSLSMGTGPNPGVAALPLMATGGGVGVGGGGGDVESSLSQNSSTKQQSDSVSNNTSVTNLDAQSGALEAMPRKSIETFGQRTSIYRGVTRHRWTGRYEAHLWDNSCRREGQTRKGRQVYLGGYDKEEKAARAYDLAAIKYWGSTTTTNFPISDYEKQIEDMKPMTRQEYVASLRRKSSGFSRGASIYRGVTRHHQHGRWQARIGRVAGNKDLYLGTFSTQEEAAEAYDIAAIKFRGLNAVTNFEINKYDVKAILESTNLPIGGAAKRLKEAEQLNTLNNAHIIKAALAAQNNQNAQLTIDHQNGSLQSFSSWPAIAFQQAQPIAMQQYTYGNAGQQQRVWLKQEQDSIGSTHYQFNNGTHDFFQMNNLMGMENSNTAVYGNGGDCLGVGGGYGLPYATTVIAHDGNNDNANGNDNTNGYENYYSYINQATNTGGVRGAVGTYDQGLMFNRLN